MCEFFKGWRRKVGVLTLVVACVFMGLWVRGHSTFDRVTIAGRDSFSVFHFSNQRFGSLGVYFSHGRITNRNKLPRTEWISHSYGYTPEQIQMLVQENDAYETSAEAKAEGFWTRQFLGFQIGGTNTSSEFAIAYCSIVIPLTLLSAFLLLSKPRSSIQKKTDDPISAEGK